MEKRTKEGFVGRNQVMGKEGICVCTPSLSWSSQNGTFDKHLLGRNVSVRKLGAHLWETFPVCQQMGVSKMDKISSQVHKHQAEGTSSVMSEAARHSVQLLPERRRNHCHKPKSSETDISSPEVESYSLSDSDSSPSISTRKLGTSFEMFKVLSRMRNQENQKISRSSHLEALSVEQPESRKRIKDLHMYDRNERWKVEDEIEKLMEGSCSRNLRSQSKLLSNIQALKSELDDERRRRKQMEILNCKLAQDMNKVQLSFSTILKKLEKEKCSNKMVEELCDEFAKEILDRLSDKTFAKQRRLKEDKGICRIAEAWLDERNQSNRHPDKFIFGKLSTKMEPFIKATLFTDANLLSSQEERSPFRRSSESFLLNDPSNQIPALEDNSTENELSCFEQHKRTTARRSTSSSIGIRKYSVINSQLLTKQLSRKYSAANGEQKKETQTSDLRDLSADGSSPMQQLHSKLTTSPLSHKHHSHQKSKEGSLGSHLLDARRHQYSASKGSKSQSVGKHKF